MQRLPHRIPWLLCLSCMLGALGVAATASRGADGDGDTRTDLLTRELKRRDEITRWALEKHPPQQELLVRLYDPVFKGNTEDYPRNMELAEKFKGRAKEASDNRQQETAEKYMRVAKLFYDAAQVNKQIVAALQARDGIKLDEGYKQITEIEDNIFVLTGKRPYREWFTPEELRQAALRAAAAKADKSGKAPAEQKPPPPKAEAQPETPAAK